ncbi:MAG: hypothetical protein NDF55_03110 [archaeon GB-1867-005]|nr:hypothetical protein [Candidatus Culexmicrobium cathedralense]
MGRFEVMALLQAARYYLLSGDREKAYSFGLNRAIFYAWAKHKGKFQAKVRKRRLTKPIEQVKEGDKIMVYFGDEGAFISPRGWFMIGNIEQRPEDFKRQVIYKINTQVPFEKAWKAAINYVSKFGKNTLLSQQKFYEKVYKPVRDNFLNLISSQATSSKNKIQDLSKFIKNQTKATKEEAKVPEKPN